MNKESWEMLSRIAKGATGPFDFRNKFVVSCLQVMKSREYIRVYMDGSADITEAGRAALASYQQELKNQVEQETKERTAKEEDRAYAAANDRKQRHHDYFVAAFQVVLGWVLGLIAEHHFQIVAFIVNFFEKLVSR